MQQLNQEAIIKQVSAASQAGTDAVESDVVDISGANGVLFLTHVATANAGNYIKVQQGDEVGGGDMADLEGSKVVIVAGKPAWAEVYKPTKRYVRLVVVRGASTAVSEIVAFVYDPRILPVSVNNDGTTIKGLALISPAEGTA